VNGQLREAAAAAAAVAEERAAAAEKAAAAATAAALSKLSSRVTALERAVSSAVASVDSVVAGNSVVRLSSSEGLYWFPAAGIAQLTHTERVRRVCGGGAGWLIW
jgi:hypothetical protein